MASASTRAKLNLTLAITGRRADGYHLLHSLVAFADIGDRIEAGRADLLALDVTGPFSGGLSRGADNLVLRAARLLQPKDAGARITLDKQLPLASGIGGGSGDAAATLSLLRQLWELPIGDEELRLRAEMLGADVAVCLHGKACWMEKIGGAITPIQSFPRLFAVIANPGIACPTPAVFEQYRASAKGFSAMPESPAGFANRDELLTYLARHGNDLEEAAISLHPTIRDALNRLAALPGFLLARMSGSGASCYGLFASLPQAQTAAARLQEQQPDWWIRSASLR